MCSGCDVSEFGYFARLLPICILIYAAVGLVMAALFGGLLLLKANGDVSRVSWSWVALLVWFWTVCFGVGKGTQHASWYVKLPLVISSVTILTAIEMQSEWWLYDLRLSPGHVPFDWTLMPLMVLGGSLAALCHQWYMRDMERDAIMRAEKRRKMDAGDRRYLIDAFRRPPKE